MRNVVIFHHNDNDGYASARVCYEYAIKKLGCEASNISTVTVFLNKDGGPGNFIYETAKNFSTDQKLDRIFIVDLSFSDISILSKINEIAPITWIDHHANSIEAIKENKLDFEYEVSDDCSAAKICWEYFFPEDSVPEAIELISDHDIFAHTMPGSIEFFNGTSIYPMKDIANDFWNELLAQNGMLYNDKIVEIINAGKLILRYNQEFVFPMISHNAFEFSLEFCDSTNKRVCYPKCIAVNTSYGNSAVFGDAGEGYKKYNLCVTYRENSNNSYTYTIYSDQYKDCAKICKYFGGGGHPGAAGFTIAHNLFDPTNKSYRKTTIIKTRGYTYGFIINNNERKLTIYEVPSEFIDSLSV